MPRLSKPNQTDDEDKLSRVNNALFRIVNLLAQAAISEGGRGLIETEEAKHHEVDQQNKSRT
jgi:hypothetical protein